VASLANDLAVRIPNLVYWILLPTLHTLEQRPIDRIRRNVITFDPRIRHDIFPFATARIQRFVNRLPGEHPPDVEKSIGNRDSIFY